MGVFKAIQERRSIRRYSSRPVEEEKLQKVLEAARLAPSARNSQLWKFIVVRDEGTRKQLAEAAPRGQFIKDAPVVIVACGLSPGFMSCGQARHTVDVSIAVSFMILEAYELGLGTCWLGCHDPVRFRKILGIPDDVEIVAVTPLGYPDETPAPKPRKALDEIVCYERWGQPSTIEQ